MERRVRSYWIIRKRYRLIANLATLAGAVVGIVLIAFLLDLDPTALRDPSSLLRVMILVAILAMLPRLVVMLVWRSRRWTLKERLG